MITIDYDPLEGKFQAVYNGTLQCSDKSLTRLLVKLARFTDEIETEVKGEHE